ncbi:MAG: hypothetical protein OQK12_06195 [Motiliproteus sp.]|nr:hypothetical protein [Motiliproteus sp.]MCW9051681.1 hypothetical protein [Motiliproteus sp.]
MHPRHPSILGTVGNTPLVRINKLAPSSVNLCVKLETYSLLAKWLQPR